mgnify:CR=1 FL=1|tara:strand:- start:126 stop:554 length:429 start_codon:yes stop_codon:yes gene_type:complete
MTLFHYKPDSGNWEYGNFKCQKLDLTLLNDMLTKDKLKIIKLKEIAWKGKHHYPYNLGESCYCCGGVKYNNCNPEIPGIIAYNCDNPYDNKYTMLDGRHRITKHLNDGKTESEYYVFDFNKIKHLIRPYNRHKKEYYDSEKL